MAEDNTLVVLHPTLVTVDEKREVEGSLCRCVVVWDIERLSVQSFISLNSHKVGSGRLSV